MDNTDLEVLKTAALWLDRGLRCELITVLKTWGSSPRPPGSMLAICEDGCVVGSVSGGCIEDDMIERARREGLTRQRPDIVSYGLTAAEAHRFGLPCGGTISLAIEPLSADSHIDQLVQRLQAGELLARRLDLHTGKVDLHPALPGQALQVSSSLLVSVHGPRWRLLIIGAGQLSRFVAQIAQGMDYAVTVCDPREEYRKMWQVDGVAIDPGMPDDVVLAMRPDARSAVIALTHDPKLDDLALMEALRSDAFYVGAIGSRLNNQRRRERMAEHFDLTPQQLDRLHGPIGLYVGSKTPPEIAVSILAELTAVKNGVALPDAMRIASAKAAAGIEPSSDVCALPEPSLPV
ncbi:MAG: XdhC family protein [Polaromonas sp.]|jgi:xanthine dehydrogenase accessory factor|nr:XdhC family protein [Polaromonas sp.]MDB5843077.1 XdhC family protein [Polaromonas sp.]MDB5938968.1 XdhC family protein [Polaromonas sp.]